MNKGKRILNAMVGVGIVLLGLLMVFYPKDTYSLIAMILSASLIIYGLQTIFYYFNMARFMVGGRLVLYRGIVFFDMGVFLATIMDIPRIYVMGYLFIVHAFSGVVDILRTAESFRYGASSWRLSFVHGMVNVVLSIACLVNIGSLKMATLIYAYGLIYSGIVHIIQSLRNTNNVYMIEV